MYRISQTDRTNVSQKISDVSVDFRGMTLNKKYYYKRLPDDTADGINTGTSHHTSRLESEQTETVASNSGPGPYPS